MIIMGVYYTLCDGTLIFQIYYYRWKRRSMGSLLRVEEDGPTEQSCLLGDNALVHGSEAHPTSVVRVLVQYAAAVVFVMVTGVLAYLISEETEDDGSSDHSLGLDWRVQVIGWLSTALYRKSGDDMSEDVR
ncbi:hypothetical protein JVU11DRAFT_3429 [Chiua virens]|nr:hypothetical protein JVU11DRAFT_3429 [Chiua virens]